MSPRAFPYRFEEAAELEEARQRAERLTINERCDEAAAMFILSLVDIARRSTDVDDYMARLDRDPPGCPTDRWRELQARRAARASE